ncbi:MAG: PIN domain-containing protein [Thermoanaerobaculia bacterium]
MIFVDTSVWIAAFRDAGSKEARQLSLLLDADEAALSIPAFLEVLAGASRPERERLRNTLTALPLFYPTNQTWQAVERWIDAASDSGERFGFADLLIGAIAAEQGASLWSLDTDFRRMARLKFLSLFAPTA